jgi:hypothetical protein
VAVQTKITKDSSMQARAVTQSDYNRVFRDQTLVMLVFFIAITVATDLLAQEKESKDDEIPKPRLVKLKAKDGVELRAFYGASLKGKEAITVLIVHEWKGQASPYYKLTTELQKAGCAVLIPEFRGHGGSREYFDARGQNKQFNVSRMSKRDIENIINMDLEASKKFLKRENNEGKLNLNALVVIGIHEGAVFAGHWSQRDWKFPSVGRKKQGQDVKALIYISPEKQIKGIGIDTTLTDRDLIQLPIMLIAGERGSDGAEAKRIAKRVEGMKRKLGRGTPAGFDFQALDTKLSGPRLINDVAAVIPSIIDFITTEVQIGEEENPWVERL